MHTDPDVASVALLIGDPTRAAMLAALLGGQALPAGELAACAQISPQTASTHLAKLVGGGLLTMTTTGRHRYYRLKSPEVGAAWEALARIAPRARVRSLRASEEARALRFARTCYDHLAGVVGVAITQAMLNKQLLTADAQTYHVTEAGTLWCAGWGIDLGQLRQSRRHFATPCLDWSERHPHLAGALGAAVAQKLFERGWIVRVSSSRAVCLTAPGREGLRRELNINSLQ
ncbi:MAG: winged helix-turn-helix transcriptional regulator [Herpetosiphonaceae bacterium]|nr:winged helix-turn-helix transcriptional regulator [Herpetosiphonaceae bacterium]